MFAESVRKAIRQVRSLDVRTILIVSLIVVSTGHVGRLFADRENERQTFIGYVLALSLDGVLAVSLYEAANVQKRVRRVYALAVFLFACVVSAGFNIAYYCQNYPADPVWVSALLGATAPIMAALVSVLKSLGDVERSAADQTEREVERALELEKYRIEQAEQTKRVQIEQTERTKRERAKARAEQAKAVALEQPTERGNGNGRLKAGELDDAARVILLEQPDIGPRPLARKLDCPPSTASGILKRLREEPVQKGGDTRS